jgi:hypothetical protein
MQIALLVQDLVQIARVAINTSIFKTRYVKKNVTLELMAMIPLGLVKLAILLNVLNAN